MARKWLIRTVAKQIVGPVDKGKIVELLDRGELAEEDEISSGNGYWFWIKEKELVDRYIYGDKVQSFDPISPVPTVLAADVGTEPLEVEVEDTVILKMGENSPPSLDKKK